jgi:PIN domain nuclease of toxin-antitoxin system
LRLLLDTHTLLWWGHSDPRLGRLAAAALESPEHEVFVSAVSAMEVSLKNRIGKLPEADVLAQRFEDEIEAFGFAGLPISLPHARLAGALDIPHRDPFDRLLIAQALIEDLVLVSNEQMFDAFGVKRLW